MFRSMRRKQKEISVEATNELLLHSRRGVLAMNGNNGYPYAIPINYFYDENTHSLYFHGAKAGQKIDSLQVSDKVCFTIMGDETIKAETWTPYVQSVIVYGRCHLIKDQEKAMQFLKQFALKYYPSEAMVDDQIAAMGQATQMFQIEIEHLSGKEIQEK